MGEADDADDYGYYGYGYSIGGPEVDRSSTGFNRYSGTGGRSYTPYSPYNYNSNRWRKEAEIPGPLFLNNYFRVKFTCGTCGGKYVTFSTRPDVEIDCVFCGKEGTIEAEEVFEEFELKEEYRVCPSCSLAVDTNGSKPVACPKCGGVFDAKLEKGQEAKTSN